MISIANTSDGYVVAVHVIDKNGKCHAWLPLRNFGDRQSDAKDFAYLDVPKLTIEQIWQLSKRYDPAIKYKRISSHKFVKTS
ncbi:MAG: hypothetical protein MJY66_08355 [Bacteroidaceae bacterium]|nr:hypothetical protein [Bacteroidaceae bacterium]